MHTQSHTVGVAQPADCPNKFLPFLMVFGASLAFGAIPILLMATPIQLHTTVVPSEVTLWQALAD